eukprot:COSAG04_NODE_88_length_27314_cov_6.056476_11_plen_113_part_00
MEARHDARLRRVAAHLLPEAGKPPADGHENRGVGRVGRVSVGAVEAAGLTTSAPAFGDVHHSLLLQRGSARESVLRGWQQRRDVLEQVRTPARLISHLSPRHRQCPGPGGVV